MTERSMYASWAPVFKVDGQVKGELARDLARLEVEETTAGLKTLKAWFLAIGPSDAGREERLLYLDGAAVDFGRQLQVSVGPPEGERIVFIGTMSGLEADFAEGEIPTVVVFAEDALMQLRMTRRSRTYKQVTDADIASQIASDHGLRPSVAAPGPTYDVVQQWNQSDLAFLRERARMVQAEIWCDDDTLHFKTRPNRNATKLSLIQGNQLASVRIRADLAHQRTKVTISGYDAEQRETLEEDAGSDAVQAEITRGRSGPAVLQQALGERTSQRVRETPMVSGEAQAWARAEMLRRSRRFITVVGTTHGSPDMVVGSTLTFERVGGPFSGDGYYVTRVRHTYDLRDGLRTLFEAERASVNPAA